MGPMGHTGLALATSIAAFVNAGLLFRGLKRREVYHTKTNWWALGAKVVVACLAMSVVLIAINNYFGEWYTAAIFERVGILAVLVTSGILVYFTTLLLFGIRRADVVPPQTSV